MLKRIIMIILIICRDILKWTGMVFLENISTEKFDFLYYLHTVCTCRLSLTEYETKCILRLFESYFKSQLYLGGWNQWHSKEVPFYRSPSSKFWGQQNLFNVWYLFVFLGNGRGEFCSRLGWGVLTEIPRL